MSNHFIFEVGGKIHPTDVLGCGLHDVSGVREAFWVVAAQLDPLSF